jgi:hypothetical protein
MLRAPRRTRLSASRRRCCTVPRPYANLPTWRFTSVTSFTVAGWGEVKGHLSHSRPRPGVPSENLPLHRKNFSVTLKPSSADRHCRPIACERGPLLRSKDLAGGGGVYAPPLLLAPDAARCAPSSSRVAARGWLNVRFSADCGRTADILAGPRRPRSGPHNWSTVASGAS